MLGERALPYSAAHDFAKYVAAAFVGRDHAVVHQECRRARMVCGDAKDRVDTGIVAWSDTE